MVSRPTNGNVLYGLFRILLFFLGNGIGVFGSFFGLIGTQAMSGKEPFIEIFLGIGFFYAISWGLGGLIVATGFHRKRLRIGVLSGYVAGGVVGAFLVTMLMLGDREVAWWAFPFVAFLLPPAIGGITVMCAMYVARMGGPLEIPRSP